MHCAKHVLDKTGLAALSDLKSAEWQQLFPLMEEQQSEFLAKQNLFRSSGYKWPKDALHNWSRIWEYPYAYHHLSRWRANMAPEDTPIVADVGSGVTFFPFSVAQLGCKVICTDVDPICANDLGRAKEHVSTQPGTVEFRLSDGQVLPFHDAECDAVYCISVLEHIPGFLETVSQIARILKRGGLFLLTIDLDLQGTGELRVDQFADLVAGLCGNFELVCPEATVHPADVLLTTTGPCALYQPSSWETLKHLAKQEIKKVLGRPTSPQFNYYLAVEGFVLRRT